jgi:hypothetical protein
MKYSGYLFITFLTLWFSGCAKAPNQNQNLPPVIDNLRLEAETTTPGSSMLFLATVTDPDGDSLEVEWQTSVGLITSSYQDSARWQSPDSSVFVRVVVSAQDPLGNSSSDTLRFWVHNRPPIIESMSSSAGTVLNGNTITLFARASDPDSHAVSLQWSTPWGSLSSSVGDTLRWTVPDSTMHAWVALAAVDEYGATTRDTLTVIVYTEVGCAWVISQGQQEIVKLSSIGDELLRMSGFQDLQDLDIDPENRRLWVCEGDPPILHSFDLRGEELFRVVEGLARPTRLRSWYRTGSVLVLDADSAKVVEINLHGNRQVRTIGGLTRPNALDLDQRTGALWICDEGSNYLYHVADGFEGSISDVRTSPHVIRRDGYLFPVDISVEDSTGACWLVDKEAGMLVRYEPNGVDSLIVSGFQNPVAVAATWSEGLCWVLDRALDSRVIRYFFDQEQVSLDGLLFPKDLAFNRIDSHVWVLDTERNRVMRIRPDGTVAGMWTDFDFPTRIVINGGY